MPGKDLTSSGQTDSELLRAVQPLRTSAWHHPASQAPLCAVLELEVWRCTTPCSPGDTPLACQKAGFASPSETLAWYQSLTRLPCLKKVQSLDQMPCGLQCPCITLECPGLHNARTLAREVKAGGGG